MTDAGRFSLLIPMIFHDRTYNVRQLDRSWMTHWSRYYRDVEIVPSEEIPLHENDWLCNSVDDNCRIQRHEMTVNDLNEDTIILSSNLELLIELRESSCESVQDESDYIENTEGKSRQIDGNQNRQDKSDHWTRRVPCKKIRLHPFTPDSAKIKARAMTILHILGDSWSRVDHIYGYGLVKEWNETELDNLSDENPCMSEDTEKELRRCRWLRIWRRNSYLYAIRKDVTLNTEEKNIFVKYDRFSSFQWTTGVRHIWSTWSHFKKEDLSYMRTWERGVVLVFWILEKKAYVGRKTNVIWKISKVSSGRRNEGHS